MNMSVDLVIQHTKRMLRIVLSFVACLVLPCFYTLLIKGHDFLKILMNIKCAELFHQPTLMHSFLIH